MDGTGLPFESSFSWNCDGAIGLSSHRTGLHPTGQVGHGHGSHPIRRMEGCMEPRGSSVHSSTQARMVPFRHEVRILSFHPGIQEVDRWHPPWHPRASTCVGEGPPPQHHPSRDRPTSYLVPPPHPRIAMDGVDHPTVEEATDRVPGLANKPRARPTDRKQRFERRSGGVKDQKKRRSKQGRACPKPYWPKGHVDSSQRAARYSWRGSHSRSRCKRKTDLQERWWCCRCS